VIASFASAGLYCYDFDGKELWRRDLGKQAHIWGNGASPIIHGGLCILNFGPGERTFLVAVNKKTGATVWQVDEPGGNSGEEKTGRETELGRFLEHTARHPGERARGIDYDLAEACGRV